MSGKNSKEYVIFNGKKIPVVEDSLDLPNEVKSFSEVKGLKNLINLKHLQYTGPYLRKIGGLDNLQHL